MRERMAPWSLRQPRVRCGACSHQAFVPCDDGQLLAHLQGRQVVGIYPLLPDDCGYWRSILTAALGARTCTPSPRPVVHSASTPRLECSRSGNGAHMWFFFTSAVPATEARRLGFLILTCTMARGAALSIDSYDRLFPNQDVLPNGGFGNLIALPLQREARSAANTVFLDDDSNLIATNGSISSSIPRITPQRLDELIANDDEDRALAVRSATGSGDAPWRPSTDPPSAAGRDHFPESVEAALIADRVYADRAPASAGARPCSQADRRPSRNPSDDRAPADAAVRRS